MPSLVYRNANTFEEHSETTLGPSSKVVDAYTAPPAYKHYERNSKEFRRRSMDASWNLPSTSDLQPNDPTFIIRKATYKNNSIVSIDGPIPRKLLRPPLADRSASGTVKPSLSSTSVYATPLTELPPDLERTVSPPPQTQRDIIAAQRAASRANQQRIMTAVARKNSLQGVDVVMQDRSTIRSSKDSTNTMRYSYIGVDGAETDISEIVEMEWRKDSSIRQETNGDLHSIPSIFRDTPSALSQVTADSFASAHTSPTTPLASSASTLPARAAGNGDEEEKEDPDVEERMAIYNLASAPLSIDKTHDYLEDALDKRKGSPAPTYSSLNDPIQERLDRVMARMKAGNVGGVASALRNQQQQYHSASVSSSRRPSDAESMTSNALTGSDRSTPPATRRKGSIVDDGPTASAFTRARSGSGSNADMAGRRSPSSSTNNMENMSGYSLGSNPASSSSFSSSMSRPMHAKGHHPQSSIASIQSDSSSMTSPNTATGNSTLTPISSTRNDSSLGGSQNRWPVSYREDYGLDFLLQIVSMDAGEVKLPRRRDLTALEALSDLRYPSISQESEPLFAKSASKMEDLEKVCFQALVIEP